MSLKSRLQKNRESKSFGLESSGCPNFDLVLYLKKHPEITSLTAYSYDNIFAEKNGTSRKIIKSFASKEKYFEQIKKLSAMSNSTFSEKNLHFTVNLPQGYLAEIFLPPLVKPEPVVIVSNPLTAKNNNFDKIISDEMLEYLQKCVDKKINIFVVAPSNIDKSSILNVLSQTTDKNRTVVLCDDKQTLISQNPCNIRFTKTLIKNEIKIATDNIFCSEADTDDLLKIFKMILSGQNGFVVSLSANTNSDLLMTMRNLILLSNMNLFEENADFMVTSSMQVVVLLESTKNGNYRISKISEMSQNEDDESELNDIFVWDNDENHISTGIQSKFLTDKFILSKTLFSESKKHGYTKAQAVFKNLKNNPQNEITDDFSKYSDIDETPLEIIEQEPQKKSKLEKLKEKIKKNKAQFADLTDKVEKIEKADSTNIVKKDENVQKSVIEQEQTKVDNVLLQSNEDTKNSDLPQETTIKNILAETAEEAENNEKSQTTVDISKKDIQQNDFQKELDLLTNSANKEEIESIFGKDALTDKKAEKTSLTEAVADSKKDTIYNILQAEEDKIEVSEKPIKNILAEEDDEISVSETSEAPENTAIDVNQDIRDKAFFEGKSAKIVEEPELFDEISGINVDEYSDEDEIIELPDDI